MIEEYLQHAITLKTINLAIVCDFLSSDQICQLPIQTDVSLYFLIYPMILTIIYTECSKARTSY